MAAETNIFSLNDDCLEHIFYKLNNMTDELMLAKICPRFSDIVGRLWRRRKRFYSFQLDPRSMKHKDILELKEFMQILAKGNVIRDYIIADDYMLNILKYLNQFEIYVMPSVEILNLSDYEDDVPNLEDMQKLHEMMPNVKRLYITANISGAGLANFSQLQELHLYESESKLFDIEMRYLEEICEKCTQLRHLDIRCYDGISNLRVTPSMLDNLKQLQVLLLNLSSLKPHLDLVLQHSRLRELKVMLDREIDPKKILNVDTHDYKIYETKEFFEILQHSARRITYLSVDHYFLPLNENWDEPLEFWRLNKLKRLAYCCCEFPMDDMLRRYMNMHDLQMLSLRNCTQLTNSIVLQMVKKCKKLEILDLTYTKGLTTELLHKLMQFFTNEQPQRQHKLEIYYVLSSLEKEIDIDNEDFWEEQKILNICTGFPKDFGSCLSVFYRGFEVTFEQ